MPVVELLHFPGCPHVPAARAQLRRALLAADLPPAWTEVDLAADRVPEHARGHGSPTVLVDGRDVTGVAPGAGNACRLYAGTEEPGAPPLAALLAALRPASPT